MRGTLKRLKARHGVPVTIIHTFGTISNYSSGERIDCRKSYVVRHALCLPESTVWTQQKSTSVLGSKSFGYGGEVSLADFVIVLDKDDLRHFAVTREGLLVTGNESYMLDGTDGYVKSKHDTFYAVESKAPQGTSYVGNSEYGRFDAAIIVGDSYTLLQGVPPALVASATDLSINSQARTILSVRRGDTEYKVLQVKEGYDSSLMLKLEAVQ